jgi:hypothetical protein
VFRGEGTVATHASSGLQEPTAKHNSAIYIYIYIYITGVNKIAPNFVTLVATYIYMTFGNLSIAQGNIYIYI